MRWIVGLVAVAGVAWYLDYLPASLDPVRLVTGRADCDVSYPNVCISPPPPVLDCSDLEVASFKVFGADPHRFDVDGDGLGCEPGEGE